MIKISKIRFISFLLIIVLLISTSSCTSCINKYVEMPEGVTLNVSSTIKEHLIQENLPSLHFDYSGVRVMMESNGSACFFVSNDQYVLSDKFGESEVREVYKFNEFYIDSEVFSQLKNRK